MKTELINELRDKMTQFESEKNSLIETIMADDRLEDDVKQEFLANLNSPAMDTSETVTYPFHLFLK